MGVLYGYEMSMARVFFMGVVCFAWLKTGVGIGLQGIKYPKNSDRGVFEQG